MSASDYERKLKHMLQARRYTVIRAAGSFGEGDLVALRPNKPGIILEVKSTSQKNFSIANGGPVGKAQWDAYVKLAAQGHFVAYAVWFKRYSWRIYSIPRTAHIGVYPVLRRDSGLDLDTFLDTRDMIQVVRATT